MPGWIVYATEERDFTHHSYPSEEPGWTVYIVYSSCAWENTGRIVFQSPKRRPQLPGHPSHCVNAYYGLAGQTRISMVRRIVITTDCASNVRKQEEMQQFRSCYCLRVICVLYVLLVSMMESELAVNIYTIHH